MGIGRHNGLYWTGLWLVVMGAALALRPPLPVDETRYLAVAWDMWLEGHYLVPHLNGEPYSHKPPLLFWLMTAGWHVFGVNEWWPRLVAPLFGLGCLFLTAHLGRSLWPDRSRISTLAPILLFGGLFWGIYTTLTMFDMMLALCTLLGLSGMVEAWRRGGVYGFVILGFAIGLGILSKGPAVLLHLLPAALAAPGWAPNLANGPDRPLGGWQRWYLGLTGAILMGAAMGLAWAIPAGIAGGEAYREAIFWGQSAGRVVDSFAHARPFWWYAAMLPALLLPWTVWPPLWRTLRRFGPATADGGVRLCIIWPLTAFVVFSMISGKQLHYLLPEFPALALLFAYMLAEHVHVQASNRDRLITGLVISVPGVALLFSGLLPLSNSVKAFLASAEVLWAGFLIVAGLLLWLRRTTVASQATSLAGATALIVVVSHAVLAPVFDTRYDLSPLARQLGQWQDEGITIANFGKYHGQYHFAGRLKNPLPAIGLRDFDERDFLKAHPKGRVIAYYKTLPTEAKPVTTFRFRRLTVAIWEAQDMIDHPHLGDRR